jgi:hypothetical protein
MLSGQIIISLKTERGGRLPRMARGTEWWAWYCEGKPKSQLQSSPWLFWGHGMWISLSRSSTPGALFRHYVEHVARTVTMRCSMLGGTLCTSHRPLRKAQCNLSAITCGASHDCCVTDSRLHQSSSPLAPECRDQLRFWKKGPTVQDLLVQM